MNATSQSKTKKNIFGPASFDSSFGMRVRCWHPGKQGGASAIEFALVFPLFFIIFYAIITYGMIMVAQQSVTLAAAEGARAALRHAADENTRYLNAQSAAIGPDSVAAWLGEHLDFSTDHAQGAAPENCSYAAAPTPGNPTPPRCYVVTVSYPYAEHPLIPLMLGPLMRTVVPDTLSSTATVQID